VATRLRVTSGRLALAAVVLASLVACSGTPDPDAASDPAGASPVTTIPAAPTAPAPRAPVTPPPGALPAPAGVFGFDHVLFKVLQKDNDAIDWTSCAGVEVTDTGATAARSILECTATDPSFEFTIRFRLFSRPADANAFLDSITLEGTPGLCEQGGSEATNWAVDEVTVGRVICDVTDNGSPAMWWGDTDDNRVVGQVNEPTAAVNWAWWVDNATIVPHS
jgi:hypothetical protein